MSNVIPLGRITHLDLSANQVLEGAKGKMSGVVLMGYDNDGELYFSSTMADGGEVLWLMENFKKRLLEAEVPEDL